MIPNRDKRIEQADLIGNKLYRNNWETIIKSIGEVDENLMELVKEIPYGTIYPREGLSLQFREVAAITTLTQLNLKPQLKTHIIAAINVGMTKDQIIELFLHLTQFIGFPLVLDGMRIAKEVFDHYKL